MPSHVLITGGAGFIGSFVAEHFLAAGSEVRILDSLDPQVHAPDAPPYVPEGAEFRRGDVRDRRALADALDGVEVVVHCAAAVGVAQSLYRVADYADTNVRGTALLLELICERSSRVAKLVVPTSMTAYGEGAYRRPSDGALVRVELRREADVRKRGWEPVDPTTGEVLEPVPTPETAELRARNVYALTKRTQEDLALSLGEVYGFPVTCLRLFNVFGPRQSLRNPYTGVLAIFLSRLLSGREPAVYEDGRQSRDFVSVHDVVRAVALAVERSDGRSAVFNVGSGVPRAIADVARDVARVLGSDLEPEVTGRFRTGDVRHCYADLERSRTLLGYEPREDWLKALAEVVRWSRSATVADRFEQADGELRARGLVH